MGGTAAPYVIVLLEAVIVSGARLIVKLCVTAAAGS